MSRPAGKKPDPEHRDALNRPIAVGDFVATVRPYNGGVAVARIVSMSPKMVRVTLLGQNRKWSSDDFSRYPSDTVLVDEQAVTFYLLTKDT